MNEYGTEVTWDLNMDLEYFKHLGNKFVAFSKEISNKLVTKYKQLKSMP